MKAMYLEEPGKIVEKEIEKPLPLEDEVLIKIKAVGVCGSDIHYYETGRIGNFVVEKPLILGHEASGEVVEVGRAVRGLKAGDRVVLEPGVPCRKCEFCKSGRYNLCPNIRFMATPPIDGAFREYVSHPADFVFKIPDGMTFEEATLIEPLSVGIHAVERAQLALGDRTLILGAGPIGLLTLQAALAKGASYVAVVDLIDARLKKAKELGADEVFNAKKTDLTKKFKDNFDVVFEATGSVATIPQTLKFVKRGGTVVLIGHPPSNEIKWDTNLVITKELNIFGVFRYKNTFPKALRLAQKRKVILGNLIGKTFPLEEVERALQYPKKHPECVKAMVIID